MNWSGSLKVLLLTQCSRSSMNDKILEAGFCGSPALTGFFPFTVISWPFTFNCSFLCLIASCNFSLVFLNFRLHFSVFLGLVITINWIIFQGQGLFVVLLLLYLCNKLSVLSTKNLDKWPPLLGEWVIWFIILYVYITMESNVLVH